MARWLALLICLAVVAGACSDDPSTTDPPPTAVATTAAPPTTGSPPTTGVQPTTAPDPTTAATTTVAAPTTLPSGAATATCVTGWFTPSPGSALRTFPLDMIRAHLGLGSGDLFIVNEMRYFDGPEDVEMISPRRNVERWYVDAYQQDDPAIAGRWIVRRIDIGEGVAYEAPAGTTGFATGTWWALDGGGFDPFTPECTVDNGPFCMCDWDVDGCDCADTSQPACTGPPPEVMGCLDGL